MGVGKEGEGGREGGRGEGGREGDREGGREGVMKSYNLSLWWF